VRLGCVAVLVVVRVVVVWQRVGEGRKMDWAWAVVLRPVPGVRNGGGQVTNDWLALVRDRVSVGVLLAHHDESLSIDGESVVK
jgi:hypothetical protein